MVERFGTTTFGGEYLKKETVKTILNKWKDEADFTNNIDGIEMTAKVAIDLILKELGL